MKTTPEAMNSTHDDAPDISMPRLFAISYENYTQHKTISRETITGGYTTYPLKTPNGLE
jgi:hypothetical protein